MARAEKAQRVTALKERIEGSEALLIADYRGLSVSDITELRRSLSQGGARLAVVKNTLMQRAAAASAIEGLESMLQGPTAVAFIEGDPVSVAKKVMDAAVGLPTLELKGGFMEGRILSADEAKALAKLESREAMLARFAGMVRGEMSLAASVMRAAQSQLMGLLNALRDKLPPQEASADEGPEGGSAEGSAVGGAEPEVEVAAEKAEAAEPEAEAAEPEGEE